MSLFSSLFSWVGKVFTKIWKSFKKILPYLMIAAALYVGFVGALPLTYLGIATSIPAGWMSALFLAGTSYLLAPEETTALVSRAVTAIGDSATAAAAAIGTAAGSLASGFFSSSGLTTALVIGGVGLAAYLVLRNKQTDKAAPPPTAAGIPQLRDTHTTVRSDELRSTYAV